MGNSKSHTSRPLHGSKITAPNMAKDRYDWTVVIKLDQNKITALHVALVKMWAIMIPWRRSNCRDTAKQILSWRSPAPSSASALSSWQPPPLEHTTHWSAMFTAVYG